MHYRHLFHAGNFADVFKHVLLLGLLQALNRKDKPWCYVDTHAGAGLYNLASNDAMRTGEWQQGIGRLRVEPDTPALVRDYLALVDWDESRPQLGHTRHYPGSPRLAAQVARPGDALLCCESIPAIAEQLRVHVPQARLHLRDGYEAHSLLPPTQKRGLVLIDPPFEARDEWTRMEQLIERVQARFAGAVLAAWYPLKNVHDAARFDRRVVRQTRREALSCQIDVGRGDAGQMHACALLVVNPPFGFAATAEAALRWLSPRLAQSGGVRSEVRPVPVEGARPILPGRASRHC